MGLSKWNKNFGFNKNHILTKSTTNIPKKRESLLLTKKYMCHSENVKKIRTFICETHVGKKLGKIVYVFVFK